MAKGHPVQLFLKLEAAQDGPGQAEEQGPADQVEKLVSVRDVVEVVGISQVNGAIDKGQEEKV